MIYSLIGSDGFECINPCNDSDFDVFRKLKGASVKSSWTPVKVRRVPMDDKSACLASDFPWLGGHALVMRIKAVDALKEILEAHGEILPLSTDDGVDLFVFNSVTIDALDYDNSVLERLKSNGKIIRVKKYVFFEEKIKDADIFRVIIRSSPTFDSVSSTFVSDNFFQKYKEAGLVGLDFNPVAN